jgi:protein-arginine kinase activator protein McsA
MSTALINRELLRPTNVGKDIAMVAVLLALNEDNLTVKAIAFKEPPTVKEITDILFAMPEGSTIVVENPHACFGCHESFESEDPKDKFCHDCTKEINEALTPDHTWMTADPSDVCEGCGKILEGGEDIRIMNDEGEDFILCEGCAEDSDEFDSGFLAAMKDDYSMLDDLEVEIDEPAPEDDKENVEVIGKDEEE